MVCAFPTLRVGEAVRNEELSVFPLFGAANGHQRRGGGPQELPEHLERKIIEHDLPQDQKQCPGCGSERSRIGCEESEQLEYEPAQLFVLVHRRWKYVCRCCQEHVATAPPAAKPIEKGRPGPGHLAALVTGNYADHLPLSATLPAKTR